MKTNVVSAITWSMHLTADIVLVQLEAHRKVSLQLVSGLPSSSPALCLRPWRENSKPPNADTTCLMFPVATMTDSEAQIESYLST